MKLRKEVWILGMVMSILLVTIIGTTYSISLQSYNGTFFEDWESGSLLTNNWTVTDGPTSGWYVATGEGPRGSYHAIARNNGAI